LKSVLAKVEVPRTTIDGGKARMVGPQYNRTGLFVDLKQI
jgi:hypothetical protein